MKITIGIVNYNSINDTKRLIESIIKNKPIFPYEIVVLDNFSKDESRKILSEMKDIKVIFKSRNTGFGRGCNDIARRSKGEFILFLNPDVIVNESSIDNLVKFMDRNREVGVCGGKLLNLDGTIQYSCRRFPTFFNVFFGRETFLTKLYPYNRFTRDYMCMDMDYEKDNEVDWLRGAVLMVRREAFEKLNGFDERFFLFLEDTDLCYRMKMEGYKVFYVSDAIFYHRLGGCMAKDLIKTRVIHNYSFYKYFKKYMKNKIISFLLDFAFISRLIMIIYFTTIEEFFYGSR